MSSTPEAGKIKLIVPFVSVSVIPGAWPERSFATPVKASRNTNSRVIERLQPLQNIAATSIAANSESLNARISTGKLVEFVRAWTTFWNVDIVNDDLLSARNVYPSVEVDVIWTSPRRCVLIEVVSVSVTLVVREAVVCAGKSDNNLIFSGDLEREGHFVINIRR